MLIPTNYNLFIKRKNEWWGFICEINANFAGIMYFQNMKLKLLFVIVLTGFAGVACGQVKHWRHRLNRPQVDTSVVVAYMDSLRAYKVKADSVSRLMDSLSIKPAADSRYFRLFSPLTFYHSIAGRSLVLGADRVDDVESAIDDVLMAAYMRRPGRVEATEGEIDRAGSLHEEITKPLRHKVKYVKKDEVVPEVELDVPLEIVVEKPNFWTFSGDYYLQFLQNYVSDNWYKGGESNYSMMASATLQANYNNKQKLKFENKLELKLGVQTSRGDTLHSVKTTEDLIRYTGKLGLQATNKWYYTFQLIAYTQFMRGYKSNDPAVYSDILSPLNMNFSLGMSYTVNALNNRLTGSIQLAPLAYNFKYVGREELATQYGLEEGKHTLNDFGSECTFDLTWTMSELIKWKSRLYAYTTYKRTEVEWENTITFQFNKFISSNVFIYPRFDDGASRDEDLGYWQFKEYASIGFAYSF